MKMLNSTTYAEIEVMHSITGGARNLPVPNEHYDEAQKRLKEAAAGTQIKEHLRWLKQASIGVPNS